MGLTEDEIKALITVKTERAHETVNEVPVHIQNGFYRTAANRLYYACYYMVSALLLKNGFETQTHKGIITIFSLHFIKTGIISQQEGKLFRDLFEFRQAGDYDELKDVSKEDVESRLEPARQFISTIEKLITM